MRATKLVFTMKNLTYKERFQRLKLPTLKYRRKRGDMIEVFTILTGKYESNVSFSFEKKHHDSRTRGHDLKLVNHRHHYDLRKYSFTERTINIWNSLPDSVISANDTDSKTKLDKFWNNQDIIYNYKAELTGIGNRSFNNSFIL